MKNIQNFFQMQSSTGKNQLCTKKMKIPQFFLNQLESILDLSFQINLFALERHMNGRYNYISWICCHFHSFPCSVLVFASSHNLMQVWGFASRKLVQCVTTLQKNWKNIRKTMKPGETCGSFFLSFISDVNNHENTVDILTNELVWTVVVLLFFLWVEFLTKHDGFWRNLIVGSNYHSDLSFLTLNHFSCWNWAIFHHQHCAWLLTIQVAFPHAIVLSFPKSGFLSL